jgi:hypothetical protein
LSAPSLLVSPSGCRGGATSANCTWDRGSAALVPLGMASGFTRRGCRLGMRLLGPAMVAEAEDSSADYLRLTKAQKVLAQRPNRPMQSGLPQPAERGTAAAGSGGRRPRGSWVASGSASHDDEQDRGPDVAGHRRWMDRWCAGARGQGRRAGNARHDAPDTWGIGRQWGPPIGARGCGSAGRTTRGEGGEPRGAF